MVDIAMTYPRCDRCGSALTESWSRITRNGMSVMLCYDPRGVSCYDAHVLEHGDGTH